MGTNCFIPSKEHNKKMEQLAREIERGSAIDSNTPPSAESLKLAHFLLANNNGNMPNLDGRANQDGKRRSTLFDNLERALGSKKAAYKAKAYIYTRDFAERYGEWVGKYDENGNPLPEPMWKDEYATDWANDFFDISAKTRKDLDDYLFENTYNTILDEPLVCRAHTYNSDSTALSRTLDEDRNNTVEKWMSGEKPLTDQQKQELQSVIDYVTALYTDGQEEAKDKHIERAKQQFFRNLYNKTTLDKLLTGARDCMIEAWGLDVDSNTGLAVNNVDQEKDPTTHDVVQIRCNLVNSLFSDADNYLLRHSANRQIVYNIVLNYLSGMSAPSISSSIFTSYLQMYKGTQLMQDTLIDMRFLKKQASPELYKNSDVEKAFTKFLDSAERTADLYASGKKSTLFEKFLNKLRSIGQFIQYALALTHQNLTLRSGTYAFTALASATLAWTSGTMPIVLSTIGAVGVTALALNSAKLAVQKELGEDVELMDLRNWKVFRKNRTEALQKVMTAIALNQEFSYAVGGDQFAAGNVVSDALLRQSGGISQVVFSKLLENLQSQLKATHESEESSRIKELIDLLEEAILNHQTSEYEPQQFFQKYLVYAIQSLDDATKDLIAIRTSIQRGNIDGIDEERLFKIKSEVIGAYNTTIGKYLYAYMNELPFKEFGRGGVLTDMVTNAVDSKLAIAKQEFDKTLKEYCDFYSDEVLKETIGKTADEKMLNNMRNNISAWFENKINNYGHLGVLERSILPARASTSPAVRMLKQKMEEIEAAAEAEANSIGNKLEYIRTSNRRFLQDRISLQNQCIKYMERSSDGKFTGNFESDTNVGEYEYLAEQERDFLDKKYKVERDDNHHALWESDDQWKKWNIDYAIWMAGGTRTESGEYKRPIDEKNQRINRRYKLQYYIDKTNILGRDGVELLAEINKRIAIIEKDARQEITYTNRKGEEVTRTFANIAKLPEGTRIRLQELQNRKRLLSSFYKINWNREHTKIVEIVQKEDPRDIELAKRFQEWDQKKSTYYTNKPQIDYEFFNAVEDYYAKDNSLGEEYKVFRRLYTQTEYNPKIQESFRINDKTIYNLKDKNGNDNELCIRLVSLKRLRNTLRQLINSNNSKRTPNLSLLGVDISSKETANLWKEIAKLEKDIYNLQQQIDRLDKLRSSDDKLIQRIKIAPSENVGKVDRRQYTTRQSIPEIDEQYTTRAGEDKVGTIFRNKLLEKNPYLQRSDLEMIVDGKTMFIPFLSRESLNQNAYLKFQNDIEPGHFYLSVPQSSFKRGESSMSNEGFDESSEDYIQVNKNFKDTNGVRPFDNSEAFDKIKNDKFYQTLIEITDEAWNNYKGLTRAYKYMLPQRELSISGQFGRAFAQARTLGSGLKTAFDRLFGDLKDFNTRDLDYRDDVIVRPDGTIVETLSSRWTKKLKDRNTIDSDLVSSVIDFYHESLKYKIRKQYAPVMELLHFQLTGGYTASSDAASRHQADVLRHEMSKILYGRSYTGSGKNGRISKSERNVAKLSKAFRSILHTRLMSHNWLSVLKNAWDSLCNLCQAALTAKHILTRNIVKAIMYLFYDPKANGLARFALAAQIGGINRSVATNLTQALMQLNGIQSNVHDRFKDQNKWAVRRMLGKTASIEFEGIDYTSKAIITNSVYDAYRLMYNPNTGEFEFLNEEEAERAYMAHGSTNGRNDGYDAWVSAGDFSLRNMYKQDEYGNAVLKEYVDVAAPAIDLNTGKQVQITKRLNLIDVVRPYSKISKFEDGRSRVLETKIRTEIKQMCQTINGMLDDMDKSQMATHYAGSLLFTFRGWMVSQSSEYYKDGYDFLNYESDKDAQATLEQWASKHISAEIPMRTTGLSQNADYDGIYNFTTGTIDRGLHKGLLKNLQSHIGAVAKMMLVIPNYLPRNSVFSSSKAHYMSKQSKMTQSEFYQLRNFAAALDALILTIFATVGAFAMYSNGEDGDDETTLMSGDAARSLIYTAMLASIAERFPQIGGAAFAVNVTDIVNALTVGVTLLDDAKYALSLASDLIDLLEGSLNENYDEDQDQIFGHLVNGSFKGKSKFQRNVTRSTAILGIDTAPILLGLDAYNMITKNGPSYLQLPDSIKDEVWIQYNLNLYKNMTEAGNIGRAKYYQTIIPANILVPLLQNTRFRISPEKKKKSNTKLKRTKSIG